MNHRQFIFVIILGFILNLQSSCKFTKFVPHGSYLLNDAKISTDTKVMSLIAMNGYIKQKPNFKTFDIFKVPLFIYSLSGKDSTKWVNRILRHAGEPPVLFDSIKVRSTVSELHRMMVNKGYLDATISPRIDFDRKKVNIIYNIKGGEPYYIHNYTINIDDSVIGEHIQPHFSLKMMNRLAKMKIIRSNKDICGLIRHNSIIKEGELFDLDQLDKERDNISSILRRSGYYEFNKDYIRFEADTTAQNHKVNLKLIIDPSKQRDYSGKITFMKHKQMIIKDIIIYVDYNPLTDGNLNLYKQTSEYSKKGYIIKYGRRGKYILPKAILNNCFIVPGILFDEQKTKYTYEALAKLHILKNVNISYQPFVENGSTKLHCIITCLPDRKQGIATELGGTYSGGFLGAKSSLGYLHRNVFKGSELFTAKLNGSFEAMKSNFEQNYYEIGGETSLTFPRFIFPFLNTDFKKRINATTQLNASYIFQSRPDYFRRTILSSSIKYIWKDKQHPQNKHVFSLVDISYVHLPKPNNEKSREFIHNLSPEARYYSFTDQFIMSSGYTFSKSNASQNPQYSARPLYSLRASFESAGNFLALMAKLAGVKKDSIGSRKIFDTRFVQYVRGTFDYSKTYFLDRKNSFAWHVGAGIAYPYGNYKQIPIEKRFFSGGAEQVRGWDVQTLGPGSYYYHGIDPRRNDNFYYHSGDMRFNANLEYRSKLFWLFELAGFVDAGNIWTLKDYPDQPGGMFKFNEFYKQIALAWGLGLRLNFNFVLLRLDCGWKAYDPSDDPNVRRWPIVDPLNFRKNVAWHIAVGYPF